MKKAIIVLLLFGLLIPVMASAQENTTPDDLCATAFPAPEPANRQFSQAEQVLQDGVDYHAVFCTSAGAVYVDLYEDRTPVTVNNFVFLAQQGYYNNTHFHRVIPDFMAQAGDPTNTGSGGPGYQFEDEFLDDLVFDRPGLLAMANAGPATNGSQFFITTEVTDWLNGAHTIFGEVLVGQENVESIRVRDPQSAFGPGTMLYTIVVVENPEEVTAEAGTFEAPTAENASAVFETLATTAPLLLEKFFPGIGEQLTFETAVAEVFTSEEALTLVNEANQETTAAFYADHNHQFTAFTAIGNTACDLETFPVQQISYRLESFGSVEDATAALNDERLLQILETEGYAVAEAPDVPFTVLTKTVTGCNDADMLEAIGIFQQGYTLVTAQVIITPDNGDFVGLLVSEFVQQFYEEALYPLLQPRVEA